MLKLYDENNVRYQLVKSNPGDQVYNWLFLPGGPGADSMYYADLVNMLDMPGNYWLIDLPANGDNISDATPMQYDFETHWEPAFLSMVREFENPILVGHSAGAMFPLLHPEMEDLLKGFVILNSAPCLWMEEAAKKAQEHQIPLLAEPMEAFEKNPNTETFKAALLACAPYYFMEKDLESGKALLEKIPFNFYAPAWWHNKASNMPYNAKWIPQKVKTLIIGASHDFITPFSLFEKDERFKRDNITLTHIDNAGHIPWNDQPDVIKEAFQTFFHAINKLL